jgi:hypothetical protein
VNARTTFTLTIDLTDCDPDDDDGYGRVVSGLNTTLTAIWLSDRSAGEIYAIDDDDGEARRQIGKWRFS